MAIRIEEGKPGILRAAVRGDSARGRAAIIAAMQGLHLTADLRGCVSTSAAMTQLDALRRLCLDAVSRAGLLPVGELFHRFPPPPDAAGPAGITGVVLLAESHLAVHTWPELGAVTLDVYVCNFGSENSAKAHALIDAIEAAFAPGEVERHALRRGSLAATANATA
jgi:S-adenosylmethionine decarboxylase